MDDERLSNDAERRSKVEDSIGYGLMWSHNLSDDIMERMIDYFNCVGITKTMKYDDYLCDFPNKRVYISETVGNLRVIEVIHTVYDIVLSDLITFTDTTSNLPIAYINKPKFGD